MSSKYGIDGGLSLVRLLGNVCPSVSLICLSYVYVPFLLLLRPFLVHFNIHKWV